MKIAYSGVPGAFAHIAAKRIFPEEELVSFRDFDEAYRSVEEGDCEYAVLPIENSYAGEVGQVLDIAFNGNLFVNCVYQLKITQNLLGVKGATVESIKKVVSHPQALAQCENYIKRHGFEKEDETNTARAARNVAKEGDITVAAIASSETAEIYGLEIIEAGINESKFNTTRFAVFSKEESAVMSADTVMNFLLMFTVKHEAGALVKAISEIGESGFNMRSLHSRPMKELPWSYYFYIEAEGDVTGEKGKAMLERLGNQCDMLKCLGTYLGDREI